MIRQNIFAVVVSGSGSSPHDFAPTNMCSVFWVFSFDAPKAARLTPHDSYYTMVSWTLGPFSGYIAMTNIRPQLKEEKES